MKAGRQRVRDENVAMPGPLADRHPGIRKPHNDIRLVDEPLVARRRAVIARARFLEDPVHPVGRPGRPQRHHRGHLLKLVRLKLNRPGHPLVRLQRMRRELDRPHTEHLLGEG